MVDYVAGVLFIKTNYGRKRRFRPRAGRQSRATRKYRIMLEDPLGAARGRAGRPSHIRDKSAPGMSGTRLQKRVRGAGRVGRPDPDSGGTHGSIKPAGGRFGAVAAPRRRFPCARGAA